MAKYMSDGGNLIKLNETSEINRIIPIEEVKESGYYEDMADLAIIFNHDIVEMANGTWRWKTNQFVNWIDNYAPVYIPSDYSAYADGKPPYVNVESFRASLDLNALWRDLHNKIFTMEEWMKYYMQIGYSLSGYAEVFGQNEASEYKLEGAKVPEGKRDEYTETVIEYMRRIHKDKVLKI